MSPLQNLPLRRPLQQFPLLYCIERNRPERSRSGYRPDYGRVGVKVCGHRGVKLYPDPQLNYDRTAVACVTDGCGQFLGWVA